MIWWILGGVAAAVLGYIALVVWAWHYQRDNEPGGLYWRKDGEWVTRSQNRSRPPRRSPG